ncbi:MAG: FkbM family methyltransferase [Bacteroidetes bacterium]|jgi:FkbM family methyltransferase|nr:FkbM family methyltransferase [Bacteroidota bacterium]
MFQHVLSRLPPRVIKRLGRLQYQVPALAPLIRFVSGRVVGTGTIRHGVGAGLRFDATGANPGFLFGTTAPEEQQLLADVLEPGHVFYDLGANVGFYAVIGASLVGATGHVYAFEPFPKSASQAERNAQLNGFAHVTVVQRAVAATSGRTWLQTSGLHNAHRIGAPNEVGMEVPVVSIDDFAREPGVRPPDVVMMDVEGAEVDALLGMMEVIRVHRPTLLVEVHWKGEDLRTVFRDLEHLGYAITRYDGRPIPERRVRYHALLRPR